MKTVQAVLMIDDDSEDREIFAEIVEAIDPSIKFVGISSAEEALLQLQKEGASLPDVIFVDLNMPVMDGRQFLIEIKSVSHLQHIRVIIYSTSSEPRHKAELLKLGASAFITKPSDLSVLKNELEIAFAVNA